MFGSSGFTRRWMAAGVVLVTLVWPSHGHGVPAAAGELETGCRSLSGPDGALTELRVAEQVVLRLRTPAAGMSTAERCERVRQRLAAALEAGEVDPRPAVVAGESVVALGGTVLVTVTDATARINGTSPGLLAWQWANNLRATLDLPPLPLAAAPYEGLAGIQPARASWYGWELAGHRTASGEPFAPEGLTAAHRTLPFGTRVRVIAPWSQAQVIVRINDRGPWVHHRDIDLSLGAARAIGLDRRGVAPVLIEVLTAPDAR